jgi:hypothetical protein
MGVSTIITIEQTGSTIELTNRVSPGMRVLVFLFGLFPLLAPYELLFKVRWGSYANLAFLFALVISLGALAVSGFFVFFALGAYSRRMYLDHSKRSLVFGRGHVLQPYRERTYGFQEIAVVDIEAHEWSDGPTSYSLIVHMNDGSQAGIGYFDECETADRYGSQLRNWISEV